MTIRSMAALGSALLLLALSGCADSPAGSPVPQLRPVEGGWISSGFGARERHPLEGYVPGGHHDGYDFAVAQGRPIRATIAGQVSYAGWLSGYGNSVVLQHPNGYSTLYGHASALKVRAGQRVKAGELLALVGSTGLSTGPHLHYELRKNGRAIEPGGFLDGTAVARGPALYRLASARRVKRASAHAKPSRAARGLKARARRRSALLPS